VKQIVRHIELQAKLIKAMEEEKAAKLK